MKSGPVKGFASIWLVRDGEGDVEASNLESIRWISPNAAVFRVESIRDRNDAESFEGAFVDIEARCAVSLLTDDADLVVDAIVKDEQGGRVLGRVISIQDNGAQPLLVIEDDAGRECLVPFVDDFVVRTEVEAGSSIVFLRTIPGLLDREESGE